MDPLGVEPVMKKSKVDDSKCLDCGKYFRKGLIKARTINTREEAENFHKEYRFFVQVGDILCSKCFTRLRVLKSKSNQSENNIHPDASAFSDLSEAAASSIVQKEDEISQILSQASLEDPETDALSYSQSTPPSSTHSASQLTSEGSLYCPPNEKVCDEVETIEIQFPRVISSKGYCFICKSNEDIHDVPLEARIQVFVKRRIFIPRRNRCCAKHMIKDRFYEDEMKALTTHADTSIVEATEINEFLNHLSNEVDSRLHDKIGNCRISEERIKTFTGYNWDFIITLRDMMTTMRESQNRNVMQALVIFLFKLRSGNSNKLIAALIEVSEHVVEDSIHSVLKCFREHVLPKYFGVNSHCREDFLRETGTVATLLYNLGSSLALICDGTYLQHQKSANNIYQKKTYSGQKKTHLCKPFTISTTNGYIVELAGPFEGTLNDAEILERIIEDPNGISSILKPGDIFILDRGFRDVVDILKAKGYQVFMPALKGNRNQLTTKESNESRFVTKIRWVVEAVHGVIAQKCKLLHNQFCNKALPDAGVYCQVACLLYNLAGKRLNSDEGEQEIIVDRMFLMKDEENVLAEKVAIANYSRKTVPFQEISSEELLDFPELTLKDLKLFFTGTYQLSQAISYLGEMLEKDSNALLLSYLKEERGIIRFEVKSRHIKSKTYKCYIHYDANEVGIDAIKGHCCNCSNGLRTIGSCSHVAALIYFLSYGRYLSKIIRPAAVLTDLFDVDNVCPVIDEDNDED